MTDELVIPGLTAERPGALKSHERNQPHGPEGLDTFEAPHRLTTVTMTSDEVTALCPVTNQPDQYAVEITYQPRKVCLESKSLKLYLQWFRNQGVFAEALASQVCQDVGMTLRCRWINVAVTQKPRGGISIVAKTHGEY